MEKQLISILVAEDDEDDRLLIKEAFEDIRIRNKIDFVNDGVELLEFLRREGDFASEKENALPGLILLDLNMPRMDGREALAIIKKDPKLKLIPVIALTTSKAQEDILKTYETGVSSFITKPVNYDDLSKIVKTLKSYWIEIVSLPIS